MEKHDNLRQLNEIKKNLSDNREVFKAFFGLLFWELHFASQSFSYNEICKQQGSLPLESEGDDQYATLLNIYLQIWDSAKDFNAASRFIADALKMSADELIQCKILFEKK